METNRLGLLVHDIPEKDVDFFIKNTSSTVNAKKVVDKVEVDFSWVDYIDEAVPYLDNIIRNPRRFIVNEEEVVPIEKTKKVSEESIKHLAVHTGLIQDVDEDGVVKPLKLLNIFREETIDLYENRFIYSLITNLYTFVREQMQYREQSISNKEGKSVNYEGKTRYKDEDVNIKLSLESNKQSEEVEDARKIEIRNEKMNHISEILEDFMASKFMKMMNNATPVRSPIRKTNVILKEQNFIKALELWEFLENFQIKKPVKEIKEEVNLNNIDMANQYDLSFYLNYCILNGILSEKGEIKAFDSTNILSSIFDYAKSFEVDEKELKRKIEAELNKATDYKNNQKTIARKAYKSFIDNHKTRMNKSQLLFR